MSTPRDRILERLRRGVQHPTAGHEPTPEREPEWLARQPAPGDLAERFIAEQGKVGGQVVRAESWEAMPEAVAPWFAEYGVRSVITGTTARLEPLRRHLAERLGLAVHTYREAMEAQRELLFTVDCGITTSRGGIAETGSVILMPGPEEPRLLSLAPPVYLAVVERAHLFGYLKDFLDTGEYQRDVPANLVLATGASRTADIEQTLTIGVHGPKAFLVALIG